MAMQEDSFNAAVEKIYLTDKRYHPDAYYFIQEALKFTAKLLNKPEEGVARHITGQELLEGIRKLALQEFGQMTVTVFSHWGLRKTEDFGDVVFNLVEAGWLKRTEKDSRAHFADGYDFSAVFDKPFLPSKPFVTRKVGPRRSRARRAVRKGGSDER